MDKETLVIDNNHSVPSAPFRNELIAWGKLNFRLLPWRLTENPYQILIAELMLHRTQAQQVVPVYNRFIQKYPDVRSLSRAKSEELHEILYSLGLRWRINLINMMASQLMSRFNGQIPQDKADLLSLPGVSEYIASATRCFSWNLPEPLIDTNTVRVVGRLFGLETKDSSRRSKRFRNLISALVDTRSPRTYNYALLDLAYQICTKKRPPVCIKCPVQKYCVYGFVQVSISTTSEVVF